MKITSKYFENVVKLKYFAATLTVKIAHTEKLRAE
jgi:hypothetical protein